MERDRTYSRVGRVFHFACALAILLSPGVALGRVSSASPFTHAKKCEFFRLAAFSMVNFREQGKTLGYGMRMVAFQLSIYKALPGEGSGEGPGLEAEYHVRFGTGCRTDGPRHLDGQKPQRSADPKRLGGQFRQPLMRMACFRLELTPKSV